MRLPPTLLALSPGALSAADLDGFLGVARRTLAAGLPGLLLREPELPDGAFLGLARELRTACTATGSWLGVHDRAHVARRMGADGLHLGFRSLPPQALPAPWREGLALGLSAHAHDDPRDWLAADYLIFGPVRDTPSKRGLVAPVGIDGFAAAVGASPRPLWAIGGVRPQDAAGLLAAGARGLAVLGGVFGTGNPAGATRRYLAALERAGAAER